MANLDDLKTLEVYCTNETCGDPVADKNGKVFFTKRRMNLWRFEDILGSATYRCPVCGRERKFFVNPLTDNIRER